MKLHVIGGPDRGASVVVGERIVIGASQTADLVLTDPTVSRFHCEIVAGDRIAIRDLGSSNGTAVDDVPVLEAFLREGSTVTVGRTEIRFEGAGEPAAEAGDPAIAEFSGLVGKSSAMARLFALLARAAESDVTVLLTGETGTGKGAAAAAIHRESARKHGPFVVIDCGAIPGPLLESELFGHERGAFTDATSARAGAFAAATGGTVLLDEIGEIPEALQPKLLRVIERREVKPLGASRPLPIDVRLIAATNRDLRAEVNAHRFRADLFYRLAVLEIDLPPLRDHPADVPRLFAHFIDQLAPAPVPAFLRSAELRAELVRHAWPGNARELRNYAERCLALLAPTPVVQDSTSDALAIDVSRPLREIRDVGMRHVERRYVADVMRLTGGNVSEAARHAQLDRVSFYRLLWRHGLR